MSDKTLAALREELAALEHEQWEKWSREVAATGLTPERQARWARFWVPYYELDEATKDHDRVWADRVLALLAKGGFTLSHPAYGVQFDEAGDARSGPWNNR